MSDRLPSADSIKQQREEILALLKEFASKVRELKLQQEWPAWSLTPNSDNSRINSQAYRLVWKRLGGKAPFIREVWLVCTDSPRWRVSYYTLVEAGEGVYSGHKSVYADLDLTLEEFPVLNYVLPEEVSAKCHRLLLYGKPF